MNEEEEIKIHKLYMPLYIPISWDQMVN